MNYNTVHIYANNLWSGEYDEFFNDETEYTYKKDDPKNIFILHIDGFTIWVGSLAKLIRNSAIDILNFDLEVYDNLTYIRGPEENELEYGEGFRQIRRFDFVRNLSEQERKRRYNNMLYGLYTFKHYVYHKVSSRLNDIKRNKELDEVLDYIKNDMALNAQLLADSMSNYKPYSI